MGPFAPVLPWVSRMAAQMPFTALAAGLVRLDDAFDHRAARLLNLLFRE